MLTPSTLNSTDWLFLGCLILAIHLLCLGILYAWSQLKGGFDKSMITNYGLTVFTFLVVCKYRENLVELVNNPPAYVFLIPVVWYGFFLLYNLSKDKQEVQQMLTQTQVRDLKLEIKEVRSSVAQISDKSKQTQKSLTKMIEIIDPSDSKSESDEEKS